MRPPPPIRSDASPIRLLTTVVSHEAVRAGAFVDDTSLAIVPVAYSFGGHGVSPSAGGTLSN